VASAAALCTLVITAAQPAGAVTTTGPTIAAGESFSLVLGATGTSMGFGNNRYGQLANTMNNNSDTANPVPSGIGPSGMIAVATGDNYGVGLTSQGEVWTFGNNFYGQLGRAANLSTNVPNPVSTRIDGFNHVTAVSAGHFHTLALRSDGTVWGFGTNISGVLGSAIDVGAVSTTPVQIPGLSNVIAIAAGFTHSLVLRADGKVLAFGANQYGEVGKPANSDANPTPTVVGGLSGVTAIAAGAFFSLALRGDGTVWGFGLNSLGQLGTTTNSGTSTPNPTPLQADVLSGIIAISGHGFHGLALKGGGTGTVFAWGKNQWGQLGKAANLVANPTPTQVTLPGTTGATGIAAGNQHSLVLRSDGKLTAFGQNEAGQLGMTANANPNPTPAEVLTVSGLGQPPSFAPLVPARLLDSRPGATTIDGDFAGGGTRAAGSLTTLRVVGRGGVPNDATAVALNVTVTSAEGTGFITVYPCGSSQPNASSLNYTAGSTIANAVIAKVGASGNVCLFTSASVQLIADVNAYYRESPAFVSLTPARLLDTRPDSLTVDGRYEGSGPVEADSVTEVSITTRGGVLADATAVALNVTVNEAKATGFVTVYPCGSARPNASNLNYVAGTTIANAVIVKIGVAGNVCFYTSAATNLIVDVNAFFRDTPSSASLVPARLLDSRPTAPTIDGASAGIGLRPGDSVTELQVFGRGGVPGGATAVVLNVTVTEPQGNAFVTVFPCGSPRPNASNVNYTAGLTIPNLVIAKVGDEGKVCLYSLAATHLIADVNAYYS
jgi:alpha-tubulin suppressor-like RCC1 family protein